MEKLPFERIEREILIKKEEKGILGKYPEERTIEELIHYGITNINKPAGPTSHQVAEYVKKILKIKTSGHSGTLDPNVTGCLPVALDKATRITQFLLTAGKEYICLMHIHKDIPPSKIHKTAKEFTGKIRQLPPVKSAIKRQWREREIYYFTILEIQGRGVLFRIGCQAGTYIRKCCHDFGLKLGTNAHMTQLIRTRAGPFTDESWYSLQELKDAYEEYKQGNFSSLKKIILPIEAAITHLPFIWVRDSAILSLTHGRSLAIPGIAKLHTNIEKENVVAILSLKNELVAIGKATMDSQSMLKKDKGIAVHMEKVFMKLENSV